MLLAWGYHQHDGSGLSYGYAGLLEMPLRDIYGLLERVNEVREEVRAAQQKANEAAKRRK